jgi:hypothetical protein
MKNIFPGAALSFLCSGKMKNILPDRVFANHCFSVTSSTMKNIFPVIILPFSPLTRMFFILPAELAGD